MGEDIKTEYKINNTIYIDASVIGLKTHQHHFTIILNNSKKGVHILASSRILTWV